MRYTSDQLSKRKFYQRWAATYYEEWKDQPGFVIIMTILAAYILGMTAVLIIALAAGSVVTLISLAVAFLLVALIMACIIKYGKRHSNMQDEGT